MVDFDAYVDVDVRFHKRKLIMPVFALVLASLVKTRLKQLRQRHKAIMLLVKKGKNHPASRASFCLFLY